MQAKLLEDLHYVIRALLCGTESIFSDSILIPKLIKEGKWEILKEILN